MKQKKGNDMKKTILVLFVVMALGAQAQYDTLPYNVGLPNYFMNHPIDSMHAVRFDNPPATFGPHLNCLSLFLRLGYSPITTNFISGRVYSDSIGDLAYGFYPDSTLHVVGIAWTGYIADDYNSLFFLDTCRIKLFHPTGEHMTTIVRKNIARDSLMYSRVMGVSLGCDDCPYSYHDVTMPFFEVYFDNEIDVADSFYVSLKYQELERGETDRTYYTDIAFGWFFTGIAGSVSLYNVPDPFPRLSYREKEDDANDDALWSYGEMQAYPLLFPIIRLPGDTCPEVRDVRYSRVGNSAAIAQWDAGTNHHDWQLCYGPQGFDPEGAEAETTTVPQRALTGLTATGHYDVYVKARCRFARDEWTPWAGPFSFSMSEIGIEDGPVAVEFSVTPNPARGTATVRCEAGVQGVEVVSATGATVLSLDGGGAQACVLDLAGLAKGIYIVRITTPLGTAAQKLAVE